MGKDSFAFSNTGDFSDHLNQSTDKKDDLHQYVRRSGWPIGDYFPEPLLVEGSDKADINKSTYVYLSERLRLSLDHHFEAIGISGKFRQAWFKQAILGLLEQEQKEQKNLNSEPKPLNWPLGSSFELPSLVEGSEKINYRKHIALYLSERVRISLEEHLKGKDISKRAWLEKAILRLIRQEQEFFFNNRDKK